MKFKLKTLIVALLISLASPVSIMAGDDGNIAGEKIKLPPTSPRPKDTSYAEDNVSCYYGNGMLTFEFAEAEGKATLSVTRIEDGAKSVTSFFTWSAYTYTIGSVPGTYQLDLTTSRNSYQGFLIIE